MLGEGGLRTAGFCCVALLRRPLCLSAVRVAPDEGPLSAEPCVERVSPAASPTVRIVNMYLNFLGCCKDERDCSVLNIVQQTEVRLSCFVPF